MFDIPKGYPKDVTLFFYVMFKITYSSNYKFYISILIGLK